MRRAIRKHTRDFAFDHRCSSSSRCCVGGYILSNQRFTCRRGAAPRQGLRHYKAELSTAQSVTPGQGQTVADRGRRRRRDHQGRPRRRPRRRDDEDPAQVHADLQGRDRAAAPEDRPQRHGPPARPRARRRGRGAGGLARSRSARRCRTSTSTRSSPALDTDTRGYLQLLVGGARRGARRPGQRRCRADLKRFEPTGRDAAPAQRRAGRAPAQHPPHDPQLPAARRGARRQGRPARRARRLLQPRLPAFADQDAGLRAALQQLPGDAARDEHGAGQGRRARPTCSGRRSATCGPAPARSGPTLRQTRPFLRRDDADHPEPAAAVRARRAADGASDLRPAARDLAAVDARADDLARGPQQLLNELAYNPPGKEEGFLFWAGVGQPRRRAVFSTQDAHGPIRRGLVVASCSSLPVLQHQRPEPAARHAGRAAQPARPNAVCPATPGRRRDAAARADGARRRAVAEGRSR